MVIHGTIIGAIKVSVESVAESVISKYAIYNSKLRNIKDTTANDEMFISINGPELGEANRILEKALDRKFNGHSGWHFSTQQHLFRTNGITVEKILKQKNVNNIYK